jgi:hypothetical protein
MDLDNFFADYQKFKARVTPMLEEYEAHKAHEAGLDAESAAKLDAEIHAPLGQAPEGEPPSPNPQPGTAPADQPPAESPPPTAPAA